MHAHIAANAGSSHRVSVFQSWADHIGYHSCSNRMIVVYQNVVRWSIYVSIVPAVGWLMTR
jgi:hypothetical protein